MKIGPKYKIARRLGAPVFEKTQTQKFAISKEKRQAKFTGRARSSFGLQLIEKQKARYVYGISEKQLKNYVKKVLESKSESQTNELFKVLESRIDSVVARLGFAATRRQARQFVSHGHIKVNNIKITIPSYSVKKGDKITVREQSGKNGAFKELGERTKIANIPSWISFDMKTGEATIVGEPKAEPSELLFNIPSMFEYYRR